MDGGCWMGLSFHTYTTVFLKSIYWVVSFLDGSGMHTHTRTHTRTPHYTHIHTHTHTHMHAHKHTHTHTHTHTCIHSRFAMQHSAWPAAAGPPRVALSRLTQVRDHVSLYQSLYTNLSFQLSISLSLSPIYLSSEWHLVASRRCVTVYVSINVKSCDIPVMMDVYSYDISVICMVTIYRSVV